MPTDIPRILECQNCFHLWCYKCAYIQYFKDVRTPPYFALKFCANCAEPFDIPEVQILLAVLAWGDKIWKRTGEHIFIGSDKFFTLDYGAKIHNSIR